LWECGNVLIQGDYRVTVVSAFVGVWKWSDTG
jgi:hypothetical protein